jgi:hypothetical protein
MIPKPTIIKLSAIVGSYLLAGCFALAAVPQFKVQDEETLSGAIQSIQEAFNNSKGNATIVLPAKEKRHPWSGFFALSSVFFAVAGTGGLVWTLFGKSQQSESVSFLPRGFLPPSSEAQDNVEPRFQWPVRVATETVMQPLTQPQASSFQQRQQQLFEKLAHSPQAWVLQLIEATPVLIWGEPRSGKSELAQFIALLRILFVKHEVEVNDPQGHINPWANCFPLYGSNFNYTAIERRLKAYQERLTQTPQFPITTIWEDYPQYIHYCPSQQTGAFNFVKSVATEAHKREEFALLIAQDKPQTTPEETRALLENYFIQIHLFAQRSSTGRVIPAGRGFLKGLTRDRHGTPEEVEISMPQWMQAHYLLEMFPELESIPNVETATPATPRDRPTQANASSIDSLGPKDSKPLAQHTQPEPNSLQATATSKPPSQRLQTIKQFIQFKQQGLNKEDTIFQMWRIIKSDSQQWEDASAMHDRMSEEYRDFIEERRSLDELDNLV